MLYTICYHKELVSAQLVITGIGTVANFAPSGKNSAQHAGWTFVPITSAYHSLFFIHKAKIGACNYISDGIMQCRVIGEALTHNKSSGKHVKKRVWCWLCTDPFVIYFHPIGERLRIREGLKNIIFIHNFTR